MRPPDSTHSCQEPVSRMSLRAAAVLWWSLAVAAAQAQDVKGADSRRDSKPESRVSRPVLVECSGASKFRVDVTTNPKVPIIDQYEASWSQRWIDELEPV